MSKTKSNWIALLLGVSIGILLMAGGEADAAGGGSVPAIPAQIEIKVDGQRADIQAYGIEGTTYVRLVDVGQAVGFNVYWDGAVQVESGMPYTGKPSATGQQSDNVENIRQEIVEQTNAVRAKKGVSALTADKKLMEAAQVRATELAATTTYAHTRPDGSKFSTVTDCPYMGENIHRISTDYLGYHGLELADAAMDGWVNSSGHLENILNSEVGSIGVGIAKGKNDKGEECWYCVQLFLVRGCTITWVDKPIVQ